MSDLPDEIWRKILEMGVGGSVLDHKDLCRVSISCTRLHRLSSDPSLWSVLLVRDFPSSSDASTSRPSKSLYKTKFERDKARKLAAWRVEVLKLESLIAVCSRNLENLQKVLAAEHSKWKSVAAELADLENVRCTSVALNVWQPEVVRTSHRKMVEQCTVPVDSRISALKMEIGVCKQQIITYNKACKDQKQKLDSSKEALASLKYHPVRNFQLQKNIDHPNRKRKTLKQSSECEFYVHDGMSILYLFEILGISSCTIYQEQVISDKERLIVLKLSCTNLYITSFHNREVIIVQDNGISVNYKQAKTWQIQMPKITYLPDCVVFFHVAQELFFIPGKTACGGEFNVNAT